MDFFDFIFGLPFMAIGGVMMVVASRFMLAGKMFQASIFYLVADTCCLVSAIIAKDWQASFSMACGVYSTAHVIAKMESGEFVKTLHSEK